jgi:hypothetical protein
MSTIEKSIISNLEGNQDIIDYGDANINKIFNELDEETKKKLLKDFPLSNPDSKNIHVSLLKNIADPEIQAVW